MPTRTVTIAMNGVTGRMGRNQHLDRSILAVRQDGGCVDAAGYDGPIEVEVFNAGLWARPGDEVLRAVVSSYQAHVCPR